MKMSVMEEMLAWERRGQAFVLDGTEPEEVRAELKKKTSEAYRDHAVQRARERAFFRLYGDSAKIKKSKKNKLKQTPEYLAAVREELDRDALLPLLAAADSIEELDPEIPGYEKLLAIYRDKCARYPEKYKRFCVRQICALLPAFLEEAVPEGFADRIIARRTEEYARELEDFLRTGRLSVPESGARQLRHGRYAAYADLNTENYPDVARRLREKGCTCLLDVVGSRFPHGAGNCRKEITDAFLHLSSPEIRDLKRLMSRYYPVREAFHSAFAVYSRSGGENALVLAAAGMAPEAALDLLKENPNYAGLFEELARQERELELLRQGIVTTMPASYPDMFPLARRMDRTFVIHVGPTNSGKTHDALEALHSCSHGIYLAPLRLLAYEKYEELNGQGVPCSMKTGEEEILTPGARVQSSTIEILDTLAEYDVAVIDEAQLVSDPQRGGAWATALLGVQAEEIHVCTAPEGLRLIQDIIRDCGDTFMVVEHTRFTPLRCEKKRVTFPEDVRKGDCCIVFSRKAVHACARALEARGRRCSVIYGALPYDVRRNEAKRFINGETEVVVATDAVGMGLNLPVRRIVFLEDSKFDGKHGRYLYRSEIRQIAGRAGRYGMYEEGYVAAERELTGPDIGEAVTGKIRPLSRAYVDFPEALIGLKGKLSEIIEEWSGLPDKGIYRKAEAERNIELAKMLEEYSDNKSLIYRFLCIPFDEGRRDLVELWKDLFLHVMYDRSYDVEPWLNAESLTDLASLENGFKILDLLYNYTEHYGSREELERIQREKGTISRKIIRILEKAKLEGRRCRLCGAELPWNYPYSLCRRCHEERYGSAEKREDNV